MLAALARASSRQRRAAGVGDGSRFLEALTSTQWQSIDPNTAIVKAAAAEAATTTSTATSTSSRSFFAASSSSSNILTLSPAISRGFAAKAHKNKKKGRGGNKKNDSDSEDDQDNHAAAASSSSSSDGKSGAAKSSTSSSFNLEATRNKMAASLERLKRALSGLHAGRASPSMLEHISVTLTHSSEEAASSSSSQSHVPLQALAAVTARDAHTLVVTPFDASAATAAAITSALKLPPLRLDNVRQERSGELVVPVPRATPEAVAALSKLARSEAEAARVAVRSARKEANKAISSGGGDIGGDDAKKRSEKSVQAAADEFVKKIDAALAAKEADLAAV